MLPQEHVADFLKERSHILTDFIFDHMTETIDNLTHSETACSFSDLALQNGSENDLQEKLDTSGELSVQSLKIRTLNCDLYHYSPENVQCLNATVLTCPDVTTVTLTNVSNGSHLLPLKNLANLSKLSINLCEDCRDDGLLHYDTGIKPVLEKQGNKIISLELHGFAVVDNRSVGVLCPNIKRIDLFQARLAPLDDSVSEDGQFFRKLEEFIYHLSEDEEVDPDEEASPLSFVLENASALRCLKLTKCAELNDSIISKAIEEHSFTNLEVLQLSECNCVTCEGIESLLFTDNGLKEMKLDNCWGIHNSDFQSCKSFVKKHNLDVNLVWV
ncbi:hypothetical protein KP79_PYT17481 [Mizuhopecten yessoensis]|uniref:Uncharacterized protein n=2 Tax=Mizuhopecten yessoensis TaxID=6573 RepID=A0A210QLD7_MIZYE|nr:hypothetical protein KP79_PYT17481 [Mizuhopecten yessoensis]